MLIDTKVEKKRGGRPSRARSEELRDHILDSATEMFFTLGYGATSIETLASHAGISKRTFYARFADKADLFREVMQRVTTRLRPADVGALFAGKDCEENLHKLAHLMVHATTTPHALALQRLILAEAPRFPELALIVNSQGMRQEGIQRIAEMLASENRAGRLHVEDAVFAAEQFMQMVISVPQRRAMGLGKPMSGGELEHWARKSVKLFLNGCRADN